MVDVIRDLNARFSNTFIGRKPTKEGDVVEPLYVDTFFHSDEGVTMLRTFNRQTDKIKDEEFKEDNFILDCPQLGMMFDGEKTYYAERVPERQWKRGYNNNVIRLNVLCKVEVRELGLKVKAHNDKELVDFAYNPKYLSIQEGLESIARGKIFSFPISRKFAIGIQHKSKYPVVFYKHWIVGWLQDGVVFLPENTHHLFEELSQYVECRRA